MSECVIHEIKSWLKSALADENLTDLSVTLSGNTEKGENYMGDVIFVSVNGKTADDESKTLDLVIKCSKKSQAMRETMSIKSVFENEIHMYSRVFPTFRHFQLEKNVDDVFDSVPEYYGKFISDDREVLMIQNLKSLGYELYDRKNPLTLSHLELALREYGKWHGVSAAMQDQQPEKFKDLVGGLTGVWKNFCANVDVYKTFGVPIDDAIDLIRGDIPDTTVQKLNNLKDQVVHITKTLVYDESYFSVITHGDCWNNNHMFKYEEARKDTPVKVAMIDWQESEFISPIIDLSYFIYACTSPEDLKKFDDLLTVYYSSFSSHVKKLGSDPEKIFSYSKLLEDWKVFGKYGVAVGLLISKIALSETDEAPDFAETLEKGQDFGETFSYEIKDKTSWKQRVLGLVQHAVEYNVLL